MKSTNFLSIELVYLAQLCLLMSLFCIITGIVCGQSLLASCSYYGVFLQVKLLHGKLLLAVNVIIIDIYKKCLQFLCKTLLCVNARYHHA